MKLTIGLFVFFLSIAILVFLVIGVWLLLDFVANRQAYRDMIASDPINPEFTNNP